MPNPIAFCAAPFPAGRAVLEADCEVDVDVRIVVPDEVAVKLVRFDATVVLCAARVLEPADVLDETLLVTCPCLISWIAAPAIVVAAAAAADDTFVEFEATAFCEMTTFCPLLVYENDFAVVYDVTARDVNVIVYGALE